MIVFWKKGDKKEKNGKRSKKKEMEEGKDLDISLPSDVKKYIVGIVAFLFSIIVVFSFFERAGMAGEAVIVVSKFLVGEISYGLPIVLFLIGWICFKTRYKSFFKGLIIATFILLLGLSGVVSALKANGNVEYDGGGFGYIITYPLLKLFGFWVTQIILFSLVVIGSFIFWYLVKGPKKEKEEKPVFGSTSEKNPSLIKKIFTPKFKVQSLESDSEEKREEKKEKKREEKDVQKEQIALDFKSKQLPHKHAHGEYKLPSVELLDGDQGKPTAGDIKTNSAIIKKTLENFGIPVEMSDVHVGPAVTQYSLKPAEGIKLAKITTLNNDLSLALATHPIRIEAPIPGKSLVGVEMPNKIRAVVKLKELLASEGFQNANSNLTLCLGRDVAGDPVFANLAKMPHLLVAGSTGTGKTVFLNSLILSLLYKNSPEMLRMILIDPKRVEFAVYKEIPHLLCPVIFDAQKAINALKWLVSEMERRFTVLSEEGNRDIVSFNNRAIKEGEETLPYIVIIIDELADLMASRGREVEAGIVRLAQMARAVGIHLVLATQRPSVEVITGLIKANVATRIAFQVVSQVDSRTILDVAGAEKLLGLGDSLFLSPFVGKPKRIQGSYVSEKEVRKVIEYIQEKNEQYSTESVEEEMSGSSGGLAGALEGFSDDSEDNDPLFEEAKRVVIEAKKASASLLQRRLKIGYARAARLIDILESRGIIGPGEGAKPREVFFAGDGSVRDDFKVPEASDDDGEIIVGNVNQDNEIEDDSSDESEDDDKDNDNEEVEDEEKKDSKEDGVKKEKNEENEEKKKESDKTDQEEDVIEESEEEDDEELEDWHKI